MGVAGPLLIMAATVLTLGGCTSVQPLYGSVDSRGSATAAALRHVDFAVATSRISLGIRNELIFAFYGGEGTPDTPLYRLNVRVNDNSVPVGVERFEDLPAAYLQQLNATYTLVEIASQKTVLTGTSFANAAYDFSNQRFANVRAKRNAEDRAAAVIAGDIRTKIAAFFATRG